MTKILSVSFLGLVAACAANAPETTSTTADDLSTHACPDNVPAALAPAADQDLAFVLRASGVQEYTCNGTAWVFVAPDAQLYPAHSCEADDDAVGHHYAGPTWEWYEDGSTVVGKKAAAATVDATAIPWLLLTAVSHGANDGRMSDVTSIQRLDTVGGLAPTTGCDADHVGATANVPYTAKYFFYRSRPNAHHRVRCGA
ncbi:MAG: DUF3455 domain-containing protein [Deltaproteobacteria bacterium]|nr:DUF3455 domain-containing protein [Deltaproteobacteria bacterium]